MTTEVKTQRLAAVVPALHAAITDRITTSPRAEHYPLLAGMADQFMARFTELAPSELELSASVNMERKQQLADELEEWFERAVEPGYRMRIGVEMPEWLLQRRRKQAEYYAGVFDGVQSLPAEVRSFIDEHSPTLSLAQAQEKYQEWRQIYDAQLNKGESLQKIAEIVDLKAALIGLMRALGAQTEDINTVIYGR